MQNLPTLRDLATSPLSQYWATVYTQVEKSLIFHCFLVDLVPMLCMGMPDLGAAASSHILSL